MPEGHTLHRLAALHTRRYVGRPVAVSSPQGRFATNAEMVDGRVLESAEAHGKHLFHPTAPTSSCTCTSACRGGSPTTGCRPRSRAARYACG
jgi:formamidopyrimidine-DNA glycosylase